MSAGQSIPKLILWNTESNSREDGLEPRHLKNCLLGDDVQDVQDVHHLACVASQQGSKVDLGNELPIKALLPGREHQRHFQDWSHQASHFQPIKVLLLGREHQGYFQDRLIIRSNKAEFRCRSRLGGLSSLS